MTAILQAIKYLPASLGLKMVTKKFPSMKNFFTQAAAYGYDADRALQFLSERFGNPSAKSYEAELESKTQLAPHEAAAKAAIQNVKAPGRMARAALAYGGAGLLAGEGEEGAEQPPETPMQQSAQRIGRTAAPITQTSKATEGMATPVISGRAIAETQFAKNRLANINKNAPKTALAATGSTQTAPTAFDMFKKDQPEIGHFMEGEIAKGKSPLEAAGGARNKKALKTHILNLEEKLGQPFEGVIAQIFGMGGSAQQTQAVAPQEGYTGNALKQLGSFVQQYIQAKGIK